MSRKVTVIGAGNVGATIAYTLSLGDIASELVLIDINKEKVEELRKHIPANERNFQIITTDLDAGALLRTIGPQLYNAGHLHYFLLYRNSKYFIFHVYQYSSVHKAYGFVQ